MSGSYFNAAMPEPYRILGRQLKPFSLGHYFILKRFDCAFVSDEEVTATREDLIFAIFVCSLNWEEFHDHIQNPDLIGAVQDWGHSVGIFDLPSKARMFQEYILTGQQQPRYWLNEEEKPEESGAHWAHAVMTTLTGELGYSRSEALNAPLSMAIADFYKHAENNGVVRLMSDEEIKAIEAAEAENGA